MEPVKGKYGLWYAGTVGFATRKEAQAYIDNGGKHEFAPDKECAAATQKHATWIGYPRSQWFMALFFAAVVMAVFAWLKPNPGPETKRVGREFTSMRQCLDFIANDLGEPLKAILDKPGDISGHSTKNKLFYRCELKITGTRGPVLEGRWDRLE